MKPHQKEKVKAMAELRELRACYEKQYGETCSLSAATRRAVRAALQRHVNAKEGKHGSTK